MRQVKPPTDKHSRRVRVGARVRVLKIAPWLWARLEAAEKQRVRSMVGQTFKVSEIDEYGSPWVEKWFGLRQAHSLALGPDEMELVLPNRKKRSHPRRVRS